ncbi:MAG TPA: hypothetical protein PLM14_11190 [Candidatus Hydrogenedentes bacterium]|nr:hypothetical protein [Candidatus Hydrogenedentota bacterium]HQE83556.1 hypothetical protein [Candidatus Hydrogenedentota bacterium]HQH52961.1 hypothetical protein [Candidatus Hydrogenedentota bacterium]HQM50433.1 hypothetical protein [Candidatus Hydrogenedentota bacterium]
MGLFRHFVGTRWLAALTLLLAMALAASGGALLAQESAAARQAEEAADLVAQANALAAEGNVAEAGYTYVWVLDNYPYTPAKHDAHAALVEMKALVRSGRIDFDNFHALIQMLPAFWDLNTLEAMNVVANMEHVYAGELLKMGMEEEARQVWSETLENVLEALRAYWYDPAAYSTPRIAVYIAKKLGGPELEVTIQELEQYVELAGPCMGSYGTRAILAEYYSQAGRKRACRPHAAPLLEAADSDYVLDALESPHVDAIQKAAMRHTKAYAQAMAGLHYQALESYAALDADPTAEGTDFKEWAGYGVAWTTQWLHRDNAQMRIAAYEDYLAQRRPPGPGGTEWRERKFANLARVEMAKIYLDVGDYASAAEYADQALLETESPEILALAEDCMRKIFEAQSQPQPAP